MLALTTIISTNGLTFQPVVGKRRIRSQNVSGMPGLRCPRGFNKIGITVFKGFQISFGVTGGRARADSGVLLKIVGGMLDQLNSAMK